MHFLNECLPSYTFIYLKMKLAHNYQSFRLKEGGGGGRGRSRGRCITIGRLYVYYLLSAKGSVSVEAENLLESPVV